MTYRRTTHSITDKIFAWFIGSVLLAMSIAGLHAIFITCISMVTNDNTWDSGWALLTTKAHLPMDSYHPAQLNMILTPGFNVPYDWVKDHERLYGCRNTC